MNTNFVYRALLLNILRGKESAPRDLKIKELLGFQTAVSMKDPCVTVGSRKISDKFRFAEAFWIVSGDNRLSTIGEFNKNIGKFSDDGHRFFGAYGPKIVDQLSYVVQKLAQDSDSRQAVINIWRENPGQTRDVPCTLSLQFLLRDGSLNCVATMRSSDAWLGWPYDIFNFSCVAAAVGIYLEQVTGVKRPELGFLFLTAGSQHLYEPQWELAKGVVNDLSELQAPITLQALYTSCASVDDFVNRLRVWAVSYRMQEGGKKSSPKPR